MATRLDGQVDPNTKIRPIRESPTDDVWNTISEVIGDWGLGQTDLWGRVVTRHEEVLKTGAVEAFLYQQLNFGADCTCKKSETGQVSQRCAVCHGSLFIGGYEKSGFSTIFLAPTSTSIGGVNNKGLIGSAITDPPVLTNLVVKHKLPDQLELADGALTGTIVSPVFQITGNLGFTAAQLSGADGIRVLTTSGILCEYTADHGQTWINLFGDTSALSEPAVDVQLRVTLSRAKPTDPSPYFQLLRARFQLSQQTNVLISKKSFPEQRVLESFGVRVGAQGITWWTTPSMGRFDGTETFIQENDVFEITSGHYQRQANAVEEYPISGRYKPSNVTYVEPFNRFLSQRFNIRLLQTDEPGNKIF